METNSIQINGTIDCQEELNSWDVLSPTKKVAEKQNQQKINYQNNSREALINTNGKEVILSAEQYKKSKDWFVFVTDNSGEKSCYDLENFSNEISKGVIDGTLGSDNTIEGHFKNDEKKWEVENTTIKNFARDFSKLRNLYEPVWSFALTGLKWGVYVGVALKVIDTLVLLGSEDITLAFFFMAAIGAIFIPRIGIIAVIAISFFMTRFTGINFFMMAFSAGLTGAVLGSLPGMFLGGLYGLLRRNSLEQAHDAEQEGGGVLFKAIVLPFAGGVSLILSYIYIFNPWLMSILS